MSASREKKNRADSTYVQRRNNHEEDKDRRKHILYGVAGGMIAVLAIALLVWDSGFFQKRSTAVTIDGESFGPAAVQYYYQTALNNAYYGAMMGTSTFDYSTDPAEQVYDEESGQTWRDYLLEQAVESLTQVTALVHAAQEAGYTLTQADQAYLDSQMDALDTTWRSSGSYASLASYLQMNYGSYMDEGTLRELYSDQILAESYLNHYQDSLTYTDEEFEAYYSEHANDLDTFGYTLYTIQASVEEQTDEDGNAVELTEEETAAALETAKTQAQATAQAICDRLAAGEDAQALADEYAGALLSSSIHTTSLGSTFSSTAYADWLYDAARQSGEVTLAELDRSDSGAYNYYVVQFDSRARDDSPTADVRHILIGAAASNATPTDEEFAEAEAQAQALLEQWQSGEATEDSFAVLAVEHSADTSSQSSGGLYTGLSSLDNMEPNFLSWALDPSRQSGDTGIVKNESSSVQGWHIMYFVGWNDPAWMYEVESTWSNEDTNEWFTALTEGAEAVQGSGIRYVS